MDTRRTEPNEGARLRRPRWRDPRLIVGVVLVLLSVAGVVALVAGAQRTQTYWAVARDVGPGTALRSEDLVPVEVRLGDGADRYVPVDGASPEGRMLAGAVRQGELVPAGALVDVDPHRRSPVGVLLAEPLPTGTGVGSRVDVWAAAPKATGRGHEEPRRIAAGVEIVEVQGIDGGLGARPATRVQLMVGEDILPRMLQAEVSDARIALVPALEGR
ncbi:flagellar biosynthesis protein FlgA [Micrococcus sp.]|uniref:flagellar biosynthesis protein FlgA n=1 Tax=Micrococcus sp. TaxID=1271 RepID=UPI002A90EBB7|nr:flagellar biosynthesis protein FlgA [Micrococcus sp.]MDY6055901.1 flagellar biosynthesis protein FlgA [Micrococcus sp.]